MTKDKNIFLRHIVESIEKVESFIRDVSKAEFESSALVQDGVIRRLEIIGEAVKNLPLDFREKYPDIPWKDIAGMRDKLIHAYFEVDLDLTWEVAKRYLPDLKRKIEKILDDEMEGDEM